MPTTAEIYNAAFSDGLRPDPLLTVSEWADQFRMLSQTASAEPGRWRTDRTPYLREIMDCLSPSSGVEKVVFMKGAQVGGTEAGNNWIGYVIDQAQLALPTKYILRATRAAADAGGAAHGGDGQALVKGTLCAAD
jgi:phage terminase large subunit GpA-like protein